MVLNVMKIVMMNVMIEMMMMNVMIDILMMKKIVVVTVNVVIVFRKRIMSFRNCDIHAYVG